MDVLKGLCVCVFVAAGCAPPDDDETGVVTSARVLAVRTEPAEAPPGERVIVRALAGDRSGTMVDAAVRWAVCVARRPLAELGPVSRECLAEVGAGLVAAGTGVMAELVVPEDACRRFGPEPPDVGQGESARPVDADVTGGYRLPVRARFGAETTFAFVRLRCGLAGATQAQSADFNRRYRSNTNPAIESVARVVGGRANELGDAPLTVAPGESVSLRVTWPACEGATVACGGAERYVLFDPIARGVIERREAMRVSWFATGGRWSAARTGRERDDTARTSDNVWVAPTATGEATLWVVLRDERGGVEWRAIRGRIGG
jgi:hypothetical protein